MPLHWHSPVQGSYSPDYIIDLWGCVFREANHEWWTSVCIPLEGSIVPYMVSLVAAENLRGPSMLNAMDTDLARLRH